MIKIDWLRIGCAILFALGILFIGFGIVTQLRYGGWFSWPGFILNFLGFASIQGGVDLLLGIAGKEKER